MKSHTKRQYDDLRNQRRPVRLENNVPKMERKAGARPSRTIEAML